MTETATATATSVRAFLIADIRGYTAFTNEKGDEAAAALADRFATVTREVVSRQGGEVTELRGDEALAVFDSPRQVLRAAVQLQERFSADGQDNGQYPLSVGIGIDAGEAVAVQGGYRTGALNVAARLCGIAGPGEVFASPEIVHLARKVDGLEYLDRGEVSLKGLPEPVRVIQVARQGIDIKDCPKFAVEVRETTNLPTELSTFIGRERELVEVSGRLRQDEIRLLTLSGAGGSGKTRLALQIGREVMDAFPDGVFLVDLTPLTNPELVPRTVASTLGMEEEAGETTENLAEYLGQKQLLLILDNFEHLLPARETAKVLLQACPRLKILVTSRESLQLTGEQQYPVPPLPVPNPEHLPDLADLTRYDAISLFVNRGIAVKPIFELTSQNAPAVAEICYRLDGLPLAIELAAARIKVFPPEALLQRLSGRLKLLTGGAKDLPARQQTLRDTIDWSYDLLLDEEKAFFARLSVFRGGCTYEAAEPVCKSSGDIEALDVLSSLVEKNLVLQEGEDEARFRLLETIREYAAERLEQTAEADASHEIHAEYFHRLALSAEPELVGDHQVAWLNRLDPELDNLRGAVEWLLEHERLKEVVDIATGPWYWWIVRTSLREPLDWYSKVLEHGDQLPLRARAWASWGKGTANQFLVGDQSAARADFDAALELFCELDDARGIARCLSSIGEAAVMEGKFGEAIPYLEESLPVLREFGDLFTSWAIHFLGWALAELGRPEEARRRYEEALEFARAAGDRLAVDAPLAGMAELALAEGNLDLGLKLADQAVDAAREVGQLHDLRVALLLRSRVLTERGDLAAASEGYREGLRATYSGGSTVDTCWYLEAIALWSLAIGRLDRAAALLGAFEAIRERLEFTPAASWLSSVTKLADARSKIRTEEWDSARQRGAGMSLEQAVAYAMKTLAEPLDSN